MFAVVCRIPDADRSLRRGGRADSGRAPRRGRARGCSPRRSPPRGGPLPARRAQDARSRRPGARSRSSATLGRTRCASSGRAFATKYRDAGAIVPGRARQRRLPEQPAAVLFDGPDRRVADERAQWFVCENGFAAPADVLRRSTDGSASRCWRQARGGQVSPARVPRSRSGPARSERRVEPVDRAEPPTRDRAALATPTAYGEEIFGPPAGAPATSARSATIEGTATGRREPNQTRRSRSPRPPGRARHRARSSRSRRTMRPSNAP